MSTFLLNYSIPKQKPIFHIAIQAQNTIFVPSTYVLCINRIIEWHVFCSSHITNSERRHEIPQP